MTDDPLMNLPEQERLLFEAFTKAATGQNYDAVVGAAINVIVNAIRQEYATRNEAHARYDLLFARGKTLLLEQHYDRVTGKRRSVFPYRQTIHMPLVGDR
jgi:hypothetical protein